jgi:hypothetical protein
MSLSFSHKPNYFLCAQLIIRHIESHVQRHPDLNEARFELREIYNLFGQDLASTTTNLDGILNIADEYQIDTLEGNQKIIQSYEIDPTEHTLTFQFNPKALDSLKAGKPLITPDATLQG